jgi:hypothetical protein
LVGALTAALSAPAGRAENARSILRWRVAPGRELCLPRERRQRRRQGLDDTDRVPESEHEDPVLDTPAGLDPPALPWPLDAAGISTPGTTAYEVAFAGRGPLCRGAGPRVPSAIVDVPAGTAPFVVRVDGLTGATLLVEDARHAVSCAGPNARWNGAALLVDASEGPLRIHVGTRRRPRPGEDAFDLSIGRDPGPFVPPTGPDCDDASVIAEVGARVVLASHASLTTPDADPERDRDWQPAMDAFVGREARVLRIGTHDGARCPTVRVDVDGGHWFWRERDLRAP